MLLRPLILVLVTIACTSDAVRAESSQPPPARPGGPFHDALSTAAGNFQRSIEKVPSDPANHAGLAEIRILQWCFGLLPYQETLPAAEQAARRALELAPDSSSAHTALGVVQMGQWQWTSAKASLRKGVELNRNSAKANHWLALFLSAMGRHEEAIAHSRRAVELDSTSGYQAGLGAVLYFARQFRDMTTHMEATVAADREFAPAFDWLGLACLYQRRFDDSIRSYRRAVELSDNLVVIKAGLGHAYGIAGRESDARAVGDELARLAQQFHVPAAQRALVEIGLENDQAAFELLEQAADERCWGVCFLQVEPRLDKLREQSRYERLIGRLQFPPAE